MEIPISHVKKILSETEVSSIQFDLSNLQVSNTFNIDVDSIDFQKDIDEAYLHVLEEKKVDKLALCVEKETLDYLRGFYPEQYAGFDFDENLEAVKQRLKFIANLNTHSKKRRTLILKQEILKIVGSTKHILFSVGTELTDEVIKRISAVHGSDFTVQYSYNDEGVLVFIDDPVKNVLLRIDIFALLSKTKLNIMYGQDLDEAKNMIISRSPRMIILTHLDKAWESKSLFMEAYEYDPFIKVINYSKSPAANRQGEIDKIKKLYYDDYTELLERYLKDKKIKKPNMEGKLRNPIMDRIDLISKNFSQKNYTEMKYYLFQIGKKYNVTTMENILSKVVKY
jgi:hypothetical protein